MPVSAGSNRLKLRQVLLRFTDFCGIQYTPSDPPFGSRNPCEGCRIAWIPGGRYLVCATMSVPGRHYCTEYENPAQVQYIMYGKRNPFEVFRHILVLRQDSLPPCMGCRCRDPCPQHLLPDHAHIIKHHSWSSNYPAASVCSKMRDSSVEVAKPGMAQVC